jgi:cob(I)alamin adenosyltransferase
MPRITRVYTRTGDDGSTALGGGRRVAKDTQRLAAYGTVDELNACIGAAQAAGVCEELGAALVSIQNDLLHLGADLCVPEADRDRAPGPRIEERHVNALEKLMDRLMGELPPLENFVLPGGGPGAAHLHVARTVCRRAERETVALSRREPVGAHVISYLNRLSDALFVMARYENKKNALPDVTWDSRA